MEIIHQRSDVDTIRIANDVLNMTREEVIRRLRELIDSPALESQLERVRKDEFIIYKFKLIYKFLIFHNKRGQESWSQENKNIDLR